jgi:hypothetical protein
MKEWKMKKIVKGMMVVITVLMFACPVAADQIYYQLNDEPINSYPLLTDGQVTTIDGAYIVKGSLTLENSFSGWGDLSGYTDLAATLTFTWRDDSMLYTYSSYYKKWYINTTNEIADKGDPTGTYGGVPNSPGPYHDFAIVSLDGTQVFSNVDVGAADSLEPTTYQYTLTLTDLSLLNDGFLNYLIEAGYTGPSSSRCDFIVDSVALEITGTAAAVPVPSTVWLLGSGLLGLVGIRYSGRCAH